MPSRTKVAYRTTGKETNNPMLWSYAVFSFITIVLFRLGFCVAATVALIATLLYFLSDFRRIPRRWIFVCIAGVIAGALLYYMRLPQLAPQATLPEAGNATVTGVSRKSVIATTDSGVRLRLTGLKKENLPQKYARISYTCTIQEMPDSTFAAFERLSGVQAWCRVTVLKTTGAPDSRLARFRSATLEFLHAKFSRISPDGSRSLIAAFLLGDTDELTAEELDAFRDMGLMHLFAVSGLNIALLFGLIYLPFRAAGLPALGSALGYVVATAFLLLLDFPVPLLRAWLFMTLGLGMRILDRRITSGALLFLTAVIVELLFPLSTFTISFILSFGITAAILLFYEPIHFCFAQSSKIGNWIAAHISLTLAAGLPAFVLSFALFGSANPLSLIYNLLLVPFSGLYLFVSLVYLGFEPARYLLIGLDHLYLRFADWHSAYVQAHFPVAEPHAQTAIAGLTVMLLAALYVFALRDRLWSVRKNLSWLLPALLLVLSAPYAFTRYPERAIYAVPNQVWLYQNKTLLTDGKKLFPETIDPRTCFPVHSRNNAAARKNAPAPQEIRRIGQNCIVFAGSMKPEFWSPNALAGCSTIHLFVARKIKANATEWEQLFAAFGYKGKVAVRNYFVWYADRPLACGKSQPL